MTTDATEAIRTIVALVPYCIDSRRWSDLAALFAENVDTDYTSLFGGEPQRQRCSALVSGWRTMLADVATQHLLGPCVVHLADRTARASCHVRAFHHAPDAPGGSAWEVLGTTSSSSKARNPSGRSRSSS